MGDIDKAKREEPYPWIILVMPSLRWGTWKLIRSPTGCPLRFRYDRSWAQWSGKTLPTAFSSTITTFSTRKSSRYPTSIVTPS